jgi:hypothetical protein
MASFAGHKHRHGTIHCKLHQAAIRLSIIEAPLLSWCMAHPYPALCIPPALCKSACTTSYRSSGCTPTSRSTRSSSACHLLLKPSSCPGHRGYVVYQGAGIYRLEIFRSISAPSRVLLPGGDNIQGRSDLRVPKHYGPVYGKTTPLNAT